ncbi:MAG: hypothetical protein M0Z67_17370 [Nitrospiraceae bacterium]|nr:hypothetical protein [Nitrospiraceae bacterium]
MKDSAYVTDYFYFAVRQDKKDGKDVLLYSSGVNLDRFLPMMKGRLGLGSNPILSGLQLVKYDLCRLALSKGAVPRDQHGPAGSPDVTLSEGAWYVEPLLIENPSGILPEEIVAFCVDSYVRRVAACSLQKYEVPDSLLPPGEMQAQLHTLCKAA